jgi:hypothetical protein
MVYQSNAGLDVEEATPNTVFHFARASHNEWTGVVQRGGVQVFSIPEGLRQSTRWKINGALRSRGIKASVRYALTDDGREVYVVTAR